jgi:cohesin complex subunit SA-1/2
MKTLKNKANNKRKTINSTQRQANLALNHLSKSLLPIHEREPRTSSLVSVLLNSHRPSNANDTAIHRAPNEIPIVSHYSKNLYSAAWKVIELHNEDSNKAQLLLLNLLFRSVGGNEETDFFVGLEEEEEDGERVVPVLDEMDTEEWARIVTDLVDEMRHTPSQQILLCCDPRGAVHQASVLSGNEHPEGKKMVGGVIYQIGAMEYRKIYKEFWYILGCVALTHGGMASTASSEFDESQRESAVEGGGGGSSVVRLDAELVKDLIGRVIELSPVGQPDVRAAATMAALSMSHAVLDQSAILVKKLDVAKRQYDATKRKSGGAKSEALKVRVDSLKRSVQDLEEVVMGTVVQGLFVHRYR